MYIYAVHVTMCAVSVLENSTSESRFLLPRLVSILSQQQLLAAFFQRKLQEAIKHIKTLWNIATCELENCFLLSSIKLAHSQIV